MRFFRKPDVNDGKRRTRTPSTDDLVPRQQEDVVVDRTVSLPAEATGDDVADDLSIDVAEGPGTPPTEDEPVTATAGDEVSAATAVAAPATTAEGGATTGGDRLGIVDEAIHRPLSPMVLPRIVAVANQKGGVGKTTTAVNLGAGLAELGFRVLVVDLDPQGNASTGLGINHRNVQGSIYDVLMNGAAVEDCVEPTAVRNLFVVPATIDLAGAEIELVPAMSRELKLRRALAEVSDDYDFTLIDCPPSLGLLTVNGLAAATDVIVPIQCEYYALEGLGQLLRNVSLVKANLNPALDVRGIVLTMYDARTKLAEQVEEEVRAHFGPKVYRTVVPRTVRISEAPSFGQPVTVFDASSRGAIAYRELAKEVSRGATRRAG
jgi:chromosome partitioning protein